MHIIVASARPEELQAFTDRLAAQANTVDIAATGAQALEKVENGQADLVVVDGRLKKSSPFAVVVEILKINAMIQTAVISGLNEEEFHEQGEGLGIMARIPDEPTARDADELLAVYQRTKA